MTRLGQLSVFWHRATQPRIFLASLLLVFLSISQVSSPTQADDLYPLDFDPLFDLPLPPVWSDTAGFATTAGDLLDQIANQTQVLVRVDLRLPTVNHDRLDEDQRAQWAADQAAVEQALLDSLPDGSYQRLASAGTAVAETQSADDPDPAALILAPVKASSLTLAVDEAALAALMASDRVAQVHQASASQTRLAAGSIHSMFIADDGSFWAWGRNDYGQLGDGTNTGSSMPRQILFFDVAAVATGDYHTLALKTDGSLWAWGHNGYGQLGNGTKTHRYTPQQINLAGVAALAAGEAHTLARRTDGSLWAWGRNHYGQLGDKTKMDSATPKQILTGVAALAAGDHHTLALKTDGSLWAWGRNNYGQLGDGTKSDSATPKQILTDVAAVAAGASHTLALKTDGSLWAWGKNDYGQLGDGTKTHRYMPMSNPILTDVASVVAGDAHTLALKTDGSLWAWGKNNYGQLGDGTKSHRYSPTSNPSLTGFAALAAGDDHSLALKTDGSLWAWGYNGSGRLGDGTTKERLRPVKVMGSNPNPNTVTVVATDASASEAGLTTGTFTFTRSGSTAAARTVNYSVSGTATAGSDYLSLSRVTFAAGSATATQTVKPLQDARIEANETVILTLAAGSGYTVGRPNSATVTLTSDDVIPNVTVVATDASASEAGLTTGTFTFTRSGSTDAALTVRYSVGGTATANSDFKSLGTSVSFPVGKRQATKIVIPLQDTRVEANETVILTLAAGSGYTVGTPNSATVTLTSDD